MIDRRRASSSASRRLAVRISTTTASVILVLLLLLLLLLAMVVAVAASGTGAAYTSNSKTPGFPLRGISPDPFVGASPLVVGVVCRDGVLLLALHSVFADANEESSLLLAAPSAASASATAPKTESDPTTPANANAATEPSEPETTPMDDIDMDLPETYRGPFRIHSLDGAGEAAMVCAGWRNDGRVLADHLRSFDQNEKRVFGSYSSTAYSTNGNADTNANANANGGGVLADRASLFLARCAVSERQRPLACAGLVASSSSSPSSTRGGGGLWVVDATGAYAVRAHALGRGSEGANAILRARDWTKVDSTFARTELLRRLMPESRSESESKSNSNSDADADADADSTPSDGASDPTTKPPKGSRFEMAVVKRPSSTDRNTQGRRLKRLFAAAAI